MLKICWHWSRRILIPAALVAGLALAATVIALRYWILPGIGDYREDIAASITRAAGQRVTIGAVDASWSGLRPRLELREIQVYDRQGQPALILQSIEGTLSWWTVLVGEIRMHTLGVDSPVLTVRRDAQDHIFIGGIELDQTKSESGFADWLLRQSRVVVRNATVQWLDEKRLAPPLVLSQVNLRMENSGRRHRFGLQALPPSGLAAPLDIRADLKGTGTQDLSAWRGRIYTRLERTDLAAWQAWLPLPIDFRHGHGGIQAWLEFDGSRMTAVTADVRLGDVAMHLGKDLPEAELHNLNGRIEWKELPAGFEFHAERLTLTAKNDVNLPATDLFIKYVPARGNKIAEGEVRTNGLSLEPLVKLADVLPLPPETRVQLADLEPRGRFQDIAINWKGDWKAPQRYELQGRFSGVGMKSHGKIPAFSGVSGEIDADEKQGSLVLDSHGVSVDFPGLFREPLAAGALTAKVKWNKKGNELEFNQIGVTVENADLAGTLSGSYRTAAGTPGIIDLSGKFTRADARSVGRYIPLSIGQSTRDWLDHALLGGQSSDMRLKLKGNLADFPFAGGKRGIFEVAGKATGGVLEYVPGWPKIENITVDILFRGARMEITASKGNSGGMQITNTRAVIPDLLTYDEMLEVDGEARGPTGEMLKFIDNSPVSGMIDNFTDGMTAAGNGDFKLSLRVPLRRSDDTTVAGSYQFVNNRVSIGADYPLLEQVNGRLEFTDSSVSIPAIKAITLGGPISIAGQTQKDGGVLINLHGRAAAAGLQGFATHPAIRSLSGTADWRGAVSVRKKQADLVVESSLVGLASSLPAPFAKRAVEAVPLRIEKKMAGAGQDMVRLTYGRILSAQLSRRIENGKTTVERGMISLGGAAALPSQPGLWLAVDLPLLDMDHWRSVLDKSPSTGSLPDIAGANLKFSALDVFGKRFNDLRISARQQDGLWQANVQSRELSGTMNWNPEGRGRLQARLAQLTLPEAAPAKLGMPVEAAKETEYPALDVVAESLIIDQKKLGRLELQAVQENQDWRIEKLRISNPDATLSMDGLWQGWQRSPLTRANLHLDVVDLGKFLARLDYPDTVKRGTAKLDGQLTWAGSPQQIDYPSLTGTLMLEAHNGQFLKIEPGAGKLLGLLSLQALPRRLSLDFRDVFSDGFAFNTISGDARIANGVARTDNFKLNGSAAKVVMQGETNLARETQNLKVKITPQLGEGVSIAGAFLGGPAVGIAALLAQKILKDPIDQIAAYEYSITGTWNDPNVAKVGRTAVELP